MLVFLIKEFPECLAIIHDWLQLNSRLFQLILINQVVLVYTATEPIIQRDYLSLLDQIMHGKKQQGNSSQALLTVNNLIFFIVSVWIIGGNYTAKEMVPSLFGKLTPIVRLSLSITL